MEDSDNLNIRGAIINDILTIKKINTEVLPEHYTRKMYKNIIEANPDFNYVKLNESKNIIGYILGGTKDDGTCRIISLAVKESYRGKGYGTALINKLCKAVDDRGKIGHVSLHVRVSNKQTVKFYEKNGFENIKLQMGYYTNIKNPITGNVNEDAFYMRKYVSSRPRAEILCRTCDFPGEFKCGRCGIPLYCSKECQKKNWPFHKQYCTSIDKNNK